MAAPSPPAPPADPFHASGRRLAAVWFADIVGFSGLASRDEAAALSQVHHFQASCAEAVANHGGRIVKFIGDGAFAVFPSTENALRAALAVNERFAHASGTADARALRIGLHLGDVVAREDGDLFGDGVNTASRLQSEARPGQILVSGDVWRQLRSLSGFEFRDLGSRELRGLPHPIEVFEVRTAAAESAGAFGVVARLLREMKRRHLLVVAMAYVLAGWLLVEATAIVAAALALPEWTVTLSNILVALGLPVALLLAWAYEVTPDGIVRAAPMSDEPGFSDADLRVIAQPRVFDGSTAELPDLPTERGQPRIRLPPESTPFVGRETEIRQLRALLEDRRCRMITLTGPGGIGKTSLAVEVARCAEGEFCDGVVFVPLANQQSAAAILPAAAEHLGIKLNPSVDSRVQVVDFLRQKEMLVVIDNFEHLVSHAGVLAEMLEHAPNLRVIVTSRQRLNLKVEHVFPVDGLMLGSSLASAPAGDAIRLFVESAVRADPSFKLRDSDRPTVRELCGYLGGVPLAIELAAAWTRAMSCADILHEVRRDYEFLTSQLQDVPERHRSLEAAFDGSWRLLPESERRAFRRLAVFAGGFTRAAAETITAIGFGSLRALIDASLIRHVDSDRFEMLDVLRQFGLEKLSADALEAGSVRRAHAEYFLRQNARIAQLGQPSLDVDRDIGNSIAAWKWALEESRFDLVDISLDPLCDYFYERGRGREGEELFSGAEVRLARARNETPGVVPPKTRMRLGIRRGVLLTYLARFEEAAALLTKGLKAASAAGDELEEALANEYLARVDSAAGRNEAAERRVRSSHEAYNRLTHERGMGRTLTAMGNLAYGRGELDQAVSLYSRSLAILRSAGYRGGLAQNLCNLGIIAATQGEFAEAKRLLEESLEVSRSMGDQRGIATALQNLAVTSFRAGEHAEAETFARDGLQLAHSMGYLRATATLQSLLGKVFEATGREGEAVQMHQRGIAAAQRSGAPPTMLDTLMASAQLTARMDPAHTVAALHLILSHASTDEATRREAEALQTSLRRQLRAEEVAGAIANAESTSLNDMLEATQILLRSADIRFPEAAVTFQSGVSP